MVLRTGVALFQNFHSPDIAFQLMAGFVIVSRQATGFIWIKISFFGEKAESDSAESLRYRQKKSPVCTGLFL